MRCLFQTVKQKTSATDGWQQRGLFRLRLSNVGFQVTSNFYVVALKKMHSFSCFDRYGFTVKSWRVSNEETSSPLPGLSHVWEAAEETEETEESLSHSSHIWKHLIWAELLSLSTGGHTDTPRCGQGTNKRTLSAPSCKYLTPHLTIHSRTSLTLKLSQQHRFSLGRSLTPSSCWLKAAVSDSLHLYGVGLFSVPLSCSVCTSHICRGPRCWQPAPSLCSSSRRTLTAAATFCNVKFSHLV